MASNRGTIKKEARKALEMVKDTMPVRMNGFTILVPQHEIERLVKEYAVNSINKL